MSIGIAWGIFVLYSTINKHERQYDEKKIKWCNYLDHVLSGRVTVLQKVVLQVWIKLLQTIGRIYCN